MKLLDESRLSGEEWSRLVDGQGLGDHAQSRSARAAPKERKRQHRAASRPRAISNPADPGRL